MGVLPDLFRAQADSLYDARYPKLAWTFHPSMAISTVGAGANAGMMARIVWPATGTIDRLAVYCVADAGANVDLGVYDTTGTTRNRLASSLAVALTPTSWVQGTISLAVRGGDQADLAFSVSAGSTSVACANFINGTQVIGNLPSGWLVSPLGGIPRFTSYISSAFHVLPSTIAEASMAANSNWPLILARYA